jgi:hypothetical protein
VIIRPNIKHHVGAEYRYANIQATSIAIEDKIRQTTVSANCCPPKHNKYVDYDTFFKTLGNRFIVGGDYNDKNTFWGSRITTTKGRELHKVIKNNNLKHLSTRQTTYWPSDSNEATAFAEHLSSVFHTFPSQLSAMEEETTDSHTK